MKRVLAALGLLTGGAVMWMLAKGSQCPPDPQPIAEAPEVAEDWYTGPRSVTLTRPLSPAGVEALTTGYVHHHRTDRGMQLWHEHPKRLNHPDLFAVAHPGLTTTEALGVH